MKKALAFLLTATLMVGVFSGCSQNSTDNGADTANPSTTDAETSTVVIGATPAPHAEILEVVKPIFEAKGYKLDIKVYNDYVQPNVAVQNGDIDANYFQHQPYLDDFNAENGANLISLVGVHYEPLGVYPGKTGSLEDLADGAQIAVPNDTTNEARALLLLEVQGLIKLNPDAGLKATINDITDNPKNLKIIEIEAAQLSRSLVDVDLAVINGNYAIQAGLNAATDALAKEEADSLSGRSYINVLVVRSGDENREDLKALVEAFKDPEVKKFIEEKYQGAVVCVL